MSQEPEETYRITFKGKLFLELGEKEGQRLYDAIELMCRRSGWGIAIDNNALKFVTLARIPE